MNAFFRIVGISVFTAVVLSSCGLIEVKTDSSSGSLRAANSTQLKLEGSISLAQVWGQQLNPPQSLSRGIINVRNALVKWTDLSVTMNEHLRLDSDRIMNMPVLFITPDKAFELTGTERMNVASYVAAGGLLVLDNPNPNTEGSQTEMALRKMADDVLGGQARFSPIPKTHRLYKAYFAFDGPPQGMTYSSARVGGALPEGAPMKEIRQFRKDVNYLEGIERNGRLAIILSNKGYSQKWAEYSNNDPQLKLAVNIVAYALTTPGGIASK